MDSTYSPIQTPCITTFFLRDHSQNIAPGPEAFAEPFPGSAKQESQLHSQAHSLSPSSNCT